MAFSEASMNISVVANEAITVFRFVDIVDVSGVGELTMTDVSSDIIIGISAEEVPLSTETTPTGVVTPVAVDGVGMIELGTTLVSGVMVSSGTDGVAVAASTTGSDIIVGPLLGGGDSGDIVPILISIRTVNSAT